MNHLEISRKLRAFVAWLMGAGLTTGLLTAEELPHLSRTWPGGMPGVPVITSIVASTNGPGVTITWEGPSGAYRLLQKSKVTDPVWQPVSALPYLLRSATIQVPFSAALFEISGPAPKYAGSQACIECHNPVVKSASHTRHLGAFTNASFVALGGPADASCLPCHSVGYGLPTGFVDAARTPRLANVQCESCHGPAAVHAANPEDPVTRPRVEIASTVCGGCHHGSVPARVAQWHPPRYEDWNGSPHRSVLEELKMDFEGPAGSSVFIPNCGGCHSGTVREALLENRALPTGHEAGALGIGCATCHDAHEQQVHTNMLAGVLTNVTTGFVLTNNVLGRLYTNQLRAPLASLIDYHTVGSFATNQNPAINGCALCHNDRGASASKVDRPPHRSAQYNMLLGSFREADTTIPSNRPGTHALLEKQCVSCHMQSAGGSSGHSFRVDSYEMCRKCHENPESLVQFTRSSIQYQIQQIKAGLDFWAGTKAPEALQSYGAKAWEYATPGALSGEGPSPNVSEQAIIPEAIRKARFNLYLVFNEGSLGVHNGPYEVALLFAAYDLVLNELRK